MLGRRRPQAVASPESTLLWQALERPARDHILNHVVEERREQGAQDRDRGAFDEDARDCLDASFEATLFRRLAVEWALLPGVEEEYLAMTEAARASRFQEAERRGDARELLDIAWFEDSGG